MSIQATEAETDALRVFGLDVLAQGLRYLSRGHVTKKAWTIAAVTWRSIPMTFIDCPVTSCGLCGQKSLASNRQLRLVVTFSRQERHQGGFSKPFAKELDRLLDQVLRGDRTEMPTALTTALPRRGTILVREWQGATHQVTVGDDGFLWNGRTYRSLSSIARAITGTNWNGPRFFGMREMNGKTPETRP